MPVLLLFFRMVWVNIASRQQSFIPDVVFKSLFYLRIHELPLKSCKISSKLGHWNNFKVFLLIILMKSLEEIKACLLTKINVDEKNSHWYCLQDSSDRLIYFFIFWSRSAVIWMQGVRAPRGATAMFCSCSVYLLSSYFLLLCYSATEKCCSILKCHSHNFSWTHKLCRAVLQHSEVCLVGWGFFCGFVLFLVGMR